MIAGTHVYVHKHTHTPKVAKTVCVQCRKSRMPVSLSLHPRRAFCISIHKSACVDALTTTHPIHRVVSTSPAFVGGLLACGYTK